MSWNKVVNKTVNGRGTPCPGNQVRRHRMAPLLTLVLVSLLLISGAPSNASEKAPGSAIKNPPDNATFRVDPRPNFLGESVTITEGLVSIRDFIRFVSDFMGLPVLVDSTDKALLSRDIEIVTPLVNVNAEIVKAVLETNKIRLLSEKYDNGTEILNLEDMARKNSAGRDPRPIVVVHVDELENRSGEIDPESCATMVFDLEHARPRDAKDALHSLVNPGARSGGGSGSRSDSAGFNAVASTNTQKLVVTAKFGLLSYIQELLELIDVAIKEPKRMRKTFKVQWADATELTGFINQLINARSAGSRFGSSGQRPVTGNPTSRGSVSSTTRSASASTSANHATKVIAEPRTNKIVVQTYSRDDLEEIEDLIAEFDVEFDERKLRTNIYHVRYLKATDVSVVLDELLAEAPSSLSRRGRTPAIRTESSLRPRHSRRRSTTPRSTTETRQGAPENERLPSRIVPFEVTNTLLIQAEQDEYEDILELLEKIDTKRRQVFLEAAVVQVRSDSDLNYAIELLAGTPSETGTQVLSASNFGLTGVALDTFERSFSGLGTGGLLAVMNDGNLPLIVNFFKKNNDSQVLATPFILVDDNEANSFDNIETRFASNSVTSVIDDATFNERVEEDAGINLTITPTVSGSERAVFLDMSLSVSEFLGDTLDSRRAASAVNARITVPDDQVFVIGGLTREKRSKKVKKVPLLGDVPLLGKLFRKELNQDLHQNIYVFLKAQILTDEDFRDGRRLTRQARDSMAEFDAELPFLFDKKKGHHDTSFEIESAGSSSGWFDIE